MIYNFRLWKRCEGCSSGSSLPIDQEAPYFPGGCLPTGGDHTDDDAAPNASGPEHSTLPVTGGSSRGGSLPNARLSQSSQASQAASLLGGIGSGPGNKPNTLVSLQNLLGNQQGPDVSPNMNTKTPATAKKNAEQVEPIVIARVSVIIYCTYI